MSPENIAMTLHLLLCKKPHADNWDAHEKYPGSCTYYLEGQLEDPWSQPCRAEWLEKAKNIFALSGFEKEEDLQFMMNKLTEVLRKIEFLLVQYKSLNDVVITIISEALESLKSRESG